LGEEYEKAVRSNEELNQRMDRTARTMQKKKESLLLEVTELQKRLQEKEKQNELLKLEGKKEQRRRRTIEKELQNKHSHGERRRHKSAELNKMLSLLQVMPEIDCVELFGRTKTMIGMKMRWTLSLFFPRRNKTRERCCKYMPFSLYLVL